MGETISLLVGGLVVENFDGHWIRISIPAERIQTATDDDTKKLVTALWDAISSEIASDKASAHEIYDASLADDERESKEMPASRNIKDRSKMNETVFDWELAGRIREHQVEGKDIAERLKEQGPLVIDRLLNYYGHETSLRQLARDAGCSATYLSRIRRGHFVISPGLFALLSDFLRDRTQAERLTARPKDRTR